MPPPTSSLPFQCSAVVPMPLSSSDGSCRLVGIFLRICQGYDSCVVHIIKQLETPLGCHSPHTFSITVTIHDVWRRNGCIFISVFLQNLINGGVAFTCPIGASTLFSSIIIELPRIPSVGSCLGLLEGAALQHPSQARQEHNLLAFSVPVELISFIVADQCQPPADQLLTNTNSRRWLQIDEFFHHMLEENVEFVFPGNEKRKRECCYIKTDAQVSNLLDPIVRPWYLAFETFPLTPLATPTHSLIHSFYQNLKK